MPPERDGEVAADWDAVWEAQPEYEDLASEERSLRWRVQVDHVRARLGGVEGVKVVELGAGRATNALLYARHGAQATALDRSMLALDQARERFERLGLPLSCVEADVFALPSALAGSFDLAISFGLCEHFLDERRVAVVEAHLALLRPGGLALINVPNKYSPIYRAWMAWAKRRGTWTLGTEVPFSARELRALALRSGGEPLGHVHCGGLGTLVNQGPNAVLRRLGRRPLPVPQVQVPGLDLLAYDLIVAIGKPR